MIDEAMLRPGRLETLLYVELPKPEERVDILRALIAQRGGIINPALAEVARREECNSFSGADLESLLRKAGQTALRRGASAVEEQDVVAAAQNIKPSVGSLARYEQLRKRFETKLW
jgi:ribosome biogenesis ATPase